MTFVIDVALSTSAAASLTLRIGLTHQCHWRLDDGNRERYNNTGRWTLM